MFHTAYNESEYNVDRLQRILLYDICNDNMYDGYSRINELDIDLN
jgi:hypothetical protein